MEDVRNTSGTGIATHPPVVAGPESGRALRGFALPDTAGRTVDLWGFRGRTNLVLFYHHGGGCPSCRAYLAALAAGLPALREEEAAVLAIGPDDRAGARDLASALGQPFPFLSDPDGKATQPGLPAPALVVADRYGQVWAAWAGGEAHALPGVGEIADWLRFIGLQCPE